jgi:hypothetical protein
MATQNILGKAPLFPNTKEILLSDLKEGLYVVFYDIDRMGANRERRHYMPFLVTKIFTHNSMKWFSGKSLEFAGWGNCTSPAQYEDETTISVCFPARFTGKVISVKEDRSSMKIMWSENGGTTHHSRTLKSVNQPAYPRLIRNVNSGPFLDEGVVECVSSLWPFREAELNKRPPVVKYHKGSVKQLRRTNRINCLKKKPSKNLDRQSVYYHFKLRTKEASYADNITQLRPGAPSSLLRLPNELILMVTDWLDGEGQVALKKTNRRLRSLIPRPIVVDIREVMGVIEVCDARFAL